MKKVALFTFTGEQLCFNHALLNVLDMHEKGREAIIIMEGKSVKLVESLIESEHKLFMKAMELDLIEGICDMCSKALDVYEYNKDCGIPLLGSMSGHPPMEDYIKEGYEIITF